MDGKMTFDQLLATAGNGDLEKLRAEKRPHNGGLPVAGNDNMCYISSVAK